MKRGIVIIIIGFLLLVITAVVWLAYSNGLIFGGGDEEVPVAEGPVVVSPEEQPDKNREKLPAAPQPPDTTLPGILLLKGGRQ